MSLSPEERYLRDPNFHGLVRILEAYIAKAEYTPTEMREAAILACIHHEMNSPRFLRPTESLGAVQRGLERLSRLEAALAHEVKESEEV